MRWSWKVGELFGIGVFVHATFPLLLAFVLWSSFAEGADLLDALMSVFFVLLVFGIVVLHELGHALTARRFGVATRDITLLPIGGVARLERIPEEPRQELLIAVAGPAVNVVLALVFLMLILLVQGSITPYTLATSDTLLSNLLWVNVWLVAFNAIPAFPMDGGRVLRALLAFRMDYTRATVLAARVGKFFAIVFGIVGIVWPQIFLVLIAAFVWLGASGEASMVQVKHSLGGATLDAVIIRDVHILAPTDSLDRGIEGVLAGFQQDFPVLEEGQLVGLLTREDLLRAIAARGKDASVREAMRTTFPTGHLAERVDEVFARLQAAGVRTLPVLNDGVLEGVVTTDNIAEYLMFQNALRRPGGGRA